jgi:predicted metalloprotease
MRTKTGQASLLVLVGVACGGGRAALESDVTLRATIAEAADAIQASYAGAVAASGGTYRPARLEVVVGDTTTPCGVTEGLIGFYCEADETIYIELGAYRRLHAEGADRAHAYVIAHELGHHVQHLRGELALTGGPSVDDQRDAAARRELQAECYAGVWASTLASPGFDGERAFAALAPRPSQQRTSDHHGTRGARLRAISTGQAAGTLAACASRAPATW